MLHPKIVRFLAVLAFGVLPLVGAAAQQTPSPAVIAPGTTGPMATLPGGLLANAIDESVAPCGNFYAHACGSWLKANPIPPDQSYWGIDVVLVDRTREKLRTILDQAAADPTPETRKISDYYASCMDEGAIESKGIAALAPELARIEAVKRKQELPALVAHLQQIGVNAVFGFGSTQDTKDASRVIAEIDQGGTGLPERDYYFRTDPKSVELRAAYVAHIGAMLRLLGEAPADADKHAATVMALETSLAKSALTRVQRRNPTAVYHPMSTAKLVETSPGFAWPAFFTAAEAPGLKSLNVAVPEFFKTAGKLMTDTPLDDIKAYLRWHLIHGLAPLLPKPVVDENFAFYGKRLSGQAELRARWKRCVQLTDRQLGEALGKVYVDREFGAEGKTRILALVDKLKQAYAEDIGALSWMGELTKKQALLKLTTMADKMGYPDRWRDYSSYQVVRGDALGNLERGHVYDWRRDLAKIGKPVDPGEWYMTPPTVNAYYDPQKNDINFPAGYLQPPHFDKSFDDAVNYGNIGATIGHEMTHGFDDQGRLFDEKGNLKNWWTKEDAERYRQRSDCLADQYSGYTVVDDVKLNGRLTLGENTADNGGTRLAYAAYKSAIAGQTPSPQPDGYTPDQRFFLAYAQSWCENARPEAMRMQAQTDPHSVSEFRVNGVVANMPEFAKAFSCPAGSPMVRQTACRVW
jgi:endothelin-converting enzyme/putative endopeptidase